MANHDRLSRTDEKTAWGAKLKAFARLSLLARPAETPEEWSMAAAQAIAAVRKVQLSKADKQTPQAAERANRLFRRHGPRLAAQPLRQGSRWSVADECAKTGNPTLLRAALEGGRLDDAVWADRHPVLLSAVSGCAWQCASIAIEAGADLGAQWENIASTARGVFGVWAETLAGRSQPDLIRVSLPMFSGLLDAVGRLPAEQALPICQEAVRELNEALLRRSGPVSASWQARDLAQELLDAGFHVALSDRVATWSPSTLAQGWELHPALEAELREGFARRERETLRIAAESARQTTGSDATLGKRAAQRL
jgi:hypothetical protein